MRRVITVGSVPPEWGGTSMGGVAAVHQRINQELARAQATSQIELAGILATNRPPDAAEYPPEGIPLLVPPAAKSDERSWYFETLRQIDPDIVLFHHLGYRWSQWHVKTDVPFAGVIHSWTQLKHSLTEKNDRARQVLDRLLPAASLLIFPSRHVQEEGLRFGLRYPHRTVVIPNPLGLCFLTDNKEDTHKGNGDDRPILAVGSAIPTKRLSLVLKTAARLGRRVEVIGDGPSLDELKKEANSLGLGKRALFPGRLTASQVASAMRKAQVLCVPSASEAFGNVYIEALSCGIPVVGFAPMIEEIREAMEIDIGQGVSGGSSLEEVVDAVRSVMSRKWDRGALMRRARYCYSPQKIAFRHAAALAETMHTKS